MLSCCANKKQKNMMTCRVAAQLKIVSCVECVEVQSSTFMRLCGQDPTIRGSNQSNAVGPTDCWGKFEHPSCRKFLVNGFCINQPVFKRRNLFSGRSGFCRNLQGGETNEVSQILLNTKGNYILKSFIFISCGKQLSNPPCPSVRPSVGPSVRHICQNSYWNDYRQ